MSNPDGPPTSPVIDLVTIRHWEMECSFWVEGPSSQVGLTHIEERSTVQGCPGDLARSSLLFQVLSHSQLLPYELRRKQAIVRTDNVPTILAGEEELHTRLDRSINQQLLLVKFGLRSTYTAD